jgi:hypothetical protein
MESMKIRNKAQSPVPMPPAINLWISLQIFIIIHNGPNGKLYIGPGGNWYMKKTWTRNLVSDSLWHKII